MDEDMIQQQINDDWVDFIYYENGVKVTRYQPSWYKDPDKFHAKPIKGSTRKPTFGPRDP